MVAQEARQARPERACALNREGTSTRRMLIDELQGLRVTAAVRGHGRLKQNGSADDMHNRKRMRITMRIDTDHVVDFICKHHFHLQPRLGDNSGAGLEVKTASDSTVTSHAPTGRTGF